MRPVQCCKMTNKDDDVNKIMEYLIRGEDAPACLQWDGGAWPGADELLDNMFSLEGGSLLEQPLPDLPLYPQQLEPPRTPDVPASSCSDSGLSSDHADLTDYDQQLSPFLIQNTCASPPHLGPLYHSEGSADHSSESEGGAQPGLRGIFLDGASPEVVEYPAVKVAPKIVFNDTFQNSPTRKRRSSLAPNTAVVQPKLQKSIVHSPVTVTSRPQAAVAAQPQKPLKVSSVQVISPQPRVFCKPSENIPRKVIRVAPMAGHPRSILLPVTIKDMKDLRSIKIINAADLKNASSIKLAAANLLSQSKLQEVKMESMSSADFDYDSNAALDDSLSEASDDEDWRVPDPTKKSQYPRLTLTAEERKLLSKEGIKLPASYPLTKHEERELKRIRRKIRNKISAQDSRKRKKEYVDGLEDRVKQCSEEKQTLIKRIKILQSQNQSLTAQLKRLQHVLSTGGGGKSAQPATCLLVLLMSVALVALPSLRDADGSTAPAHTGPHALSSPAETRAPALALRRALLSAAPHKVPSEEVVLDDGEFNMEELLAFPRPHPDHDYQVSKLERGVTASGGRLPPGYLDIPLDEDWPPSLKRRIKHHFDLDDGPDYLPVIKEEDYENADKMDTAFKMDIAYKMDTAFKMDAVDKMDALLPSDLLSKDYVVDLGGKLGELMPMIAVKNEDIITEEVDHDARNVTELRSFVVNGTSRM